MNDAAVICDHNTIPMLWGSMGVSLYCVKLSRKDLSRYSNQLEQENVHIITILLKSDVTMTNISHIRHIMAAKNCHRYGI